MNVSKPSATHLKAAVSVSTMAKLVDLSRASFYAYVKRGVFLQPIYSLATRRPFYTSEMQQENMAVRTTGIGANGEYVLFYEKREQAPATRTPLRKDRHAGLLDSLRALGLDKLTHAQVEEAVATSFPKGIEGVDESVVLRVINRHLRRTGHG